MKKTNLNFDTVKFNELTEDNQMSITGGNKGKIIYEALKVLIELIDVFIGDEKPTQTPTPAPTPNPTTNK